MDHLQSTLGDEAWVAGMHPEIPETKVLDNPYQYTELPVHGVPAATTHQKAMVE